MIFSTVFDYINGSLIDKYRHRKRIARSIFIGSMVGSLGILGLFKYADFVVDNINQLFHMNIQAADLPLPVGYHFIHFRRCLMSLTSTWIKYRCREILSLGAYVTMFPRLAGPIVKYGDIAEQLISRKVSLDRFGEGAELFIRGLAKSAIGQQYRIIVGELKATPIEELSVLSAWLGITAFTLQIYFDFSGYLIWHGD